MIKTRMKIFLSLSVMVLSVSLSTLSFAHIATPDSPHSQSKPHTSALQVIVDKIYGLIASSIDTSNRLANQVDKFLDSIQKSNVAASQLTYPNHIQVDPNLPALKPTGLSNYIAYVSNIKTSAQNMATLKEIPNQATGKEDDTDIATALTNGLPASDSLFVSQNTLTDAMGESASIMANLNGKKNLLVRPNESSHNYDSVFNANTFLFPPNGSYTPYTPPNSHINALFSQGKVPPYSFYAADKYLAFLTQSYAPMSTDDIFSGLASLKGAQKVQALFKLKTSQSDPDKTYQKYQLAMRNLIAVRSLLINNLNQLLIERTPIAGLGTRAGLSPSSPYINKDGSASPLQLENYMAYHRVNSKPWYQFINTASSATVQRETLYVLARLLAKMQQAHIDREKALTISTLRALQSEQGLHALMQTEAQKLKEIVKKLTQQSA